MTLPIPPLISQTVDQPCRNLGMNSSENCSLNLIVAFIPEPSGYGVSESRQAEGLMHFRQGIEK